MGVGALNSHAIGTTHKRKMDLKKKMCGRGVWKKGPETSKNNPSSASVTDEPQPTSATCLQPVQSQPSTSATCGSTSTITGYCSTTATLKAEILLALKVTRALISFNSADDFVPLFKIMFPDLGIASKMTGSATKLRYMTTFGLGPYFTELLKDQLKATSNVVLMFDESFNADLQQKQMDVHVRFWSGNQVFSRYLTSVFMGHATAKDLLVKLLPICEDLGLDKLVQLSMDGPNVNWRLHQDLEAAINEQKPFKLLNIGSCGLHTVHNAFRAGHTAAGWCVDELLTSCYHLFNESPARREDYTNTTGSDTFPLHFCKHRWVENVPVAKRVLQLWDMLTTYMKAAKEKKVPTPTNRSYKQLEECFKDPHMKAKVNAYISISESLLPFLKGYQADKPMVAFLAEDIYVLVKALLQRILKQSALDALAGGAKKLVALRLGNEDSFLVGKQIEVGFLTDKELKGAGTERSRLAFRHEFRGFVVGVVKKIIEKSPVTFSLCRALCCLDPNFILSERTEAISLFKVLLKKLEETHHVRGEDCDLIASEFASLHEELRKQEECFDKDKHRLDIFWAQVLSCKKQYGRLWPLFCRLLTMSHGQAAVERGFSGNKEVSTVNKMGLTVIAQRQICQHIDMAGGIDNVMITPTMLTSVRGSRIRYEAYLEKEKREREQSLLSKKRKEREEEMEDLRASIKRQKKKRLMSFSLMLIVCQRRQRHRGTLRS